jgi:Uma2 family endonuclease
MRRGSTAGSGGGRADGARAARYIGGMSDAASTLMTVDEFLVAYEGREGRWEIENGVVYAQAAEQMDHGRVKGEAYIALRDAIRRAKLSCEAVTDSVAVRISSRTAYIPDAMVYCGPRLPGDAREAEPVIVIEVVSPSSKLRDERRKFVGYFSVPSVRHYLTLDPGGRSVLHHFRGDDGRIETRLLEAGPLLLDPPGLELRVEDLFGEAET